MAIGELEGVGRSVSAALRVGESLSPGTVIGLAGVVVEALIGEGAVPPPPPPVPVKLARRAWPKACWNSADWSVVCFWLRLRSENVLRDAVSDEVETGGDEGEVGCFWGMVGRLMGDGPEAEPERDRPVREVGDEVPEAAGEEVEAADMAGSD